MITIPRILRDQFTFRNIRHTNYPAVLDLFYWLKMHYSNEKNVELKAVDQELHQHILNKIKLENQKFCIQLTHCFSALPNTFSHLNQLHAKVLKNCIFFFLDQT